MLISGVDARLPVRHYVREADGSVRAELVKGGVVLVLQTPAEFADRASDFPVEDKVVNINSRR